MQRVNEKARAPRDGIRLKIVLPIVVDGKTCRAGDVVEVDLPTGNDLIRAGRAELDLSGAEPKAVGYNDRLNRDW